MNLHQNLSFKKAFTRSKIESEAAQFGRDARSDWQIICLVFMFLALLAAAMALIVYAGVNKGDIFLVDKTREVSLQTLDRFLLEKTASFFEAKRERFEAFKTVPMRTTDPYIPPRKAN